MTEQARAAAGATDGKVWLITGTSTGFGRALGEAVLARGHRLAATARDEATVADLVDAAPGRAIAARADVTDEDSVRAAVAAATDAFGRIDVLVNNAGYSVRGAVEELSDKQWRHMFETNLFGVIAMTRAVLPIMRRQRGGHIVQMSSVGGVTTRMGGAPYASTKFALEGLSEGLASEVAHLGVRVTIVEPGPFRTDFSGRSVRWADRPVDDYAGIMGPERERFERAHGTQPGDPARAAEAIIDAVELDDPPLRLPLGAEAFGRIRAKLADRLAELDAVEPIGAPTDYTG